MARLSYLQAAEVVAKQKGITRKELLNTHRRAEILELIKGLGLRMTVRQQVPQEILDAGDVVAAHKGITRKEVFRSMRTAEVLALAAELAVEAP